MSKGKGTGEGRGQQSGRQDDYEEITANVYTKILQQTHWHVQLLCADDYGNYIIKGRIDLNFSSF